MVVTNGSRKESSEAPRACQLEDEWWGGEQRQGDRAPYRSFMPRIAAPPPPQQRQQRAVLHAGDRFTAGVEEQTFACAERTRGHGAERAVPGGQVVEGFREERDGPTFPAGSWGEGRVERATNMLLERGTEERKGGFTSPPPSWRKASV